MNKPVIFGIVAVAALVLVALFVYSPEVNNQDDFSNSPQESDLAGLEAIETQDAVEQEESTREIILPTLTYPNAYNGPLYATSEQIGEGYPIENYMANLDRNGINWFIGFFTFGESEDVFLSTSNGLGYLITAVKRYPGRIVPYYNPGLGGEEVEPLVGDKLTAMYSNTLADIRNVAGDGFIQGLGEIETQEWAVAHNSPKVLQLFDLAKKNNIDAMFHPVASKISQVGKIAEAYPEMKFIIHMYRADLDKSMNQLIEVLNSHDNIYFSIDAAHIAHSNNQDIVYDLEKNTIESSKSAFISQFDSKYNSMLSDAVSDYTPLVEGAPDKVMWGTEMGPDYSYEPEVYDRMIKISRELIGKMKLEHQEGLGYKNALRVYGDGIILTKDIEVADTSSWSLCSSSQIDGCDEQCGITGEGETDTDAEKEKCFKLCLVGLKCLDNLEED